MTLVLGLEYGGRTILAGDGCVSYETEVMASRTPKVFRRGTAAIGLAGEGRIFSIARHDLKLPPVPRRLDDLDRWAESTVPDALASTLRSKGIETGDFEMMLGIKGRLYLYDSSLACDRPRCGFGTIGSASDCGWVALGLQREQRTSDPEGQMRAALKWTSKRRSDVMPPFRIVST